MWKRLPFLVVVAVSGVVRILLLLAQWETVSYLARMLLWWPAALSDSEAFLSVTESEIRTGTINYFGQSFGLDPHFRYKPLISALVVSPLFALFAWRRYTRREM